MNWLLTIALHNIVGTMQALIQRSIGRTYKKSAAITTAFAFCALGCFAVLFSIVRYETLELSEGVRFLPLFIIGSSAFALQKVGVQKTYEKLHASTATLLISLNIVSAILFSSILLNERLTPIQLLGTIILILSIMFSLQIESKVVQLRQLKKSISIAILSSFLFGVGFSVERYLLLRVNVETYILFGWLLQCVLVWLLVVRIKPTIPKSVRYKKLTAVYALMFVLSGLFFVLSLKNTHSAPLVSVLSNLKIVIVSLLSVYLLHENKKLKQQVFAAFGAIIAVFMLLK